MTRAEHLQMIGFVILTGGAIVAALSLVQSQPAWLVVANVVGLAVGGAGLLAYLVYVIGFSPLVKPSVDGKVIITDPLNCESPPIDLYGQGATITIGGEGIVSSNLRK